jgi:hypothetical protein
MKTFEVFTVFRYCFHKLKKSRIHFFGERERRKKKEKKKKCVVKACTKANPILGNNYYKLDSFQSKP